MVFQRARSVLLLAAPFVLFACAGSPPTARDTSAAPPDAPASSPPPADMPEESADALAGPRVKSSDQPQSRVVNARCPIMPDRAIGDNGMCNNELTRRLGDRTVGFCCNDCLAAWDALTEVEKHLALRNVTPTTIKPERPPAKTPAKPAPAKPKKDSLTPTESKPMSTP